jgi:CubicO group peptidase (beta-lactamase class C family)
MQKLRVLFPFLIVICPVLAACAGSPAPAAAPAVPPQTVTESVFDPAVAARMEADIYKTYPNMYSILVQQHGVIVYERYYQGHNKDTYTHVFSVTKSVMSSLVGIALDQGLIKSLDQPIADFLPEYFPEPDKYNKKEITIRHALTMTSGLVPTDQTLNRWMASPDWFAYTVNQPKDYPAGEKFS